MRADQRDSRYGQRLLLAASSLFRPLSPSIRYISIVLSSGNKYAFAAGIGPLRLVADLFTVLLLRDY